MKAAGRAADGVVWVMGAADWKADAPGMKLVKDIAKMPIPSDLQPVHYMRGVCSATS